MKTIEICALLYLHYVVSEVEYSVSERERSMFISFSVCMFSLKILRVYCLVPVCFLKMNCIVQHLLPRMSNKAY